MNRRFYYEMKNERKTITFAYRFKNFHLSYLMAKMMVRIAEENKLNLTVKKLTVYLAIKNRVLDLFTNK